MGATVKRYRRAIQMGGLPMEADVAAFYSGMTKLTYPQCPFETYAYIPLILKKIESALDSFPWSEEEKVAKWHKITERIACYERNPRNHHYFTFRSKSRDLMVTLLKWPFATAQSSPPSPKGLPHHKGQKPSH